MIWSLLWRAFIMAILFVLIRKFLLPQSIARMNFIHAISILMIALFSFDYIFHTARPFLFTLIFLLFWSVFPFVLDWINIRSTAFFHWYSGKETVVIKDGKILEDELKRINLPIDTLLASLRQKGHFNIAALKRVYIDQAGEISILPSDAKEEIITVIQQGEIKDGELAKRGLNRRDVMLQLNKQGIALDNVFLGQIDDYGSLHVDLYDDALDVSSDTRKEQLITLLKKTIADLESYSLETEHKETKEMYAKFSKHLDSQILKKLPPAFEK